jgi:hypothetical protein
MHSELVTTRSRLRSEQSHQQRHAHEAGVGESSDQRAEGGVIPADARIPAGPDHPRHQQQRACQVDRGRDWIDQLRDRRAGAEAIQQAREREIKHECVESRNCVKRQHALARGDIAAQHQGEEGKCDLKDGEHGTYSRRSSSV